MAVDSDPGILGIRVMTQLFLGSYRQKEGDPHGSPNDRPKVRDYRCYFVANFFLTSW